MKDLTKKIEWFLNKELSIILNDIEKREGNFKFHKKSADEAKDILDDLNNHRDMLELFAKQNNITLGKYVLGSYE